MPARKRWHTGCKEPRALIPGLLVFMLSPRFSPWILGAISLIAARAPAQTLDDRLEEVRLQRDAVRLGAFVEIAELQSEDALQVIEASLRLVDLPITRRRIYEACAEFRGCELEEDVIDLLVEAANGKDTVAALGATRALGEFEALGVEALKKILKRGRSAEVRATAVGELLAHWSPALDSERLKLAVEQARTPYSGSRSDLLAFLRRATNQLAVMDYPKLLKQKRAPLENRLLLLHDLAERPERVAEPGLHAALESAKAVELRERALELCLDRDLELPLDLVRELSRSAPSPELQWQAACARQRIEPDSKLWKEEIRRFALSSQEGDQKIAATLLHALEEADQVDALTALLRPGNPLASRSAALDAVGRLQSAALVDVVIESLDDQDAIYFAHARRMLIDLTRRRDLGTARDWRVWWRKEQVDFVALPPREDYNVWQFQSTWSLMRGQPDGTLYGLDPVTAAVVFVVDTSSQMQRLVPIEIAEGEVVRVTSLELTRRHLAAALDALPDGTEVALVTFGDQVKVWKSKLAPLNRRTRAAFLGELSNKLAHGEGAQLYEALEAAFRFSDIDTVVVLAGRRPSRSSVLAPDLILADVRRWNRFRHLTVHSVALHRESALLEELSRGSGGRTVLAQ